MKRYAYKKLFHHTSNMLLHYLVKYERSKMTQNVEILLQRFTTLTFHTRSIIYRHFHEICSKYPPLIYLPWTVITKAHAVTWPN